MSQVSPTGWQIFVEVPGKAPIELPTGESVIGRSRACAVQIAETTVSRQHAIFVVEPGKVRLRDLGSSNGTFVNGQRVEGEIPLSDGDRVVVGEAELVLRMLAPLGPSEATARLVIPPMSAPLSAHETIAPPLFPPSPAPAGPAWAAPPPPDASPSLPPLPPLPPSAPATASASAANRTGSPTPWTPTPHSRIPPPATAAATASPAPASAPVASAGSSAAAESAPKASELLPSIRDIDLAPPPPMPRPTAPVASPPRVATSSKVEPAGFWLRLVAYLLDCIPFFILAGLQVGLAFYVSPSLARLVPLVSFAYFLLVFLVLPAVWGTTPGKKLMKLAIVSESTVPGQGLGWATAGLRLVGYMVCGLTVGLGYLLVAFSAHKQGLHDLIAKTNVVRKR